jgi:hypothetical protein
MVRCRVSFKDSDNIGHSVEVHAESLYEAVALAEAEFRAEGHTDMPAAMTEFTVSIQRPRVEHCIRLGQVAKWAEGTRDGPAGIIKRQRVKALLGNRS